MIKINYKALYTIYYVVYAYSYRPYQNTAVLTTVQLNAKDFRNIMFLNSKSFDLKHFKNKYTRLGK